MFHNGRDTEARSVSTWLSAMTVMAGLSSVEASRRLAAEGPNQLPEPRRPSALRHLGKQFTHLLAAPTRPAF